MAKVHLCPQCNGKMVHTKYKGLWCDPCRYYIDSVGRGRVIEGVGVQSGEQCRMPDNWDIFEDRAKSLLERWSKFHIVQPQVAVKSVILNFLTELNDDYTRGLIEGGEIDGSKQNRRRNFSKND
jgi:hypothetical protein